MNYLNDKDFLKENDLSKNKEVYARIILLTQDENPIEEISGKVMSGSSINKDSTSAVRRTCSLSLAVDETDVSDYYWSLKSKIKIYVGVKNNVNDKYDDILWFSQGIFVITAFNISNNISSCTVSISGQDKMCLLNGTVGGVLPASIDFKQEDFYENTYNEKNFGTKYEKNKYYVIDNATFLRSDTDFNESRKYYNRNVYNYIECIDPSNYDGVLYIKKDGYKKATEYSSGLEYYDKNIVYAYISNDVAKSFLSAGITVYTDAKSTYKKKSSFSIFDAYYIVDDDEKVFAGNIASFEDGVEYYIPTSFSQVTSIDSSKQYFVEWKTEYTVCTEVTSTNYSNYYIETDYLKQETSTLDKYKEYFDEDGEKKEPLFDETDVVGDFWYYDLYEEASTFSPFMVYYYKKSPDENYSINLDLNIYNYEQKIYWVVNTSGIGEEDLSSEGYDSSKHYFYLDGSNYYEQLFYENKEQYEENKYYVYDSSTSLFKLSEDSFNEHYTYYEKTIETTSTDIPIKTIVREMIHVYGQEPYHNIVINDIDDYGLYIKEYQGEKPLYIFLNDGDVYDFYIEEDEHSKLCYELPVSLSTFQDEYKLYLKAKASFEAIQENDLDRYNQIIQYLEMDFLNKIGIEEGDYSYIGDLMSSYENGMLSNNIETQSLFIVKADEEDEQEYVPCSVIKLEYGDAAGYEVTELTYPGELTSSLGENICSILDKIKNLFSTFEYFYDIDGRFVFEKKKNTLYSSWNNITEENGQTYVDNSKRTNAAEYDFNNNELITSINNSPNLLNLKNDYCIWGKRIGTGDVTIPIFGRLSIDKKPSSYVTFPIKDRVYSIDEDSSSVSITSSLKTDYFRNDENLPFLYQNRYFVEGAEDYSDETVSLFPISYNGKSYAGIYYNNFICDWREIIYQMAKDYYQHGQENDFVVNLKKFNPITCANYKTGYERYYPELYSFWRDIYSQENEYTFEIIDSSLVDHYGIENGQLVNTSYWSLKDYSDIVCDFFLPEDILSAEENDFVNRIDDLKEALQEKEEEILEYKNNLLNSLSYEVYGSLMQLIDAKEDEIINANIEYVNNNENITENLAMAQNNYVALTANKINTINEYKNEIIRLVKSFETNGSLYLKNNIFDWRNKNILDGGDSLNDKDEYSDESNLVLLEDLITDYSDFILDCNFQSYYFYNEYLNGGKDFSELETFAQEKAEMIIDVLITAAKEELIEIISQQQEIYSDTGLEVLITELNNLENSYKTEGTEIERVNSQIELCDEIINKYDAIIKSIAARQNNLDKDIFSDNYAYWNLNLVKNPSKINFWMDFIDVDTSLQNFSIPEIGCRTLAENDDNASSIFYRDIPDIIYNIDNDIKLQYSNYSQLSLGDDINNYFVNSSNQFKSVKDVIDDKLFNYSYCLNDINISAIPVYYLEPDSIIYVQNEINHIDGTYLVSKISISVSESGTMSITASKIPDKIS